MNSRETVFSVKIFTRTSLRWYPSSKLQLNACNAVLTKIFPCCKGHQLAYLSQISYIAITLSYASQVSLI
jgi:hypothetical protein